jgi:hypothetical protein
MLLFGPGIRAIDIDSLQRFRGKTFGDELASLFPQYPYIGQIIDIDPAAGLVTAFIIKVYGDKIPFSVVNGGFDEKITDSATYFKRKRIAVAEQGLPVGRLSQIFCFQIIG